MGMRPASCRGAQRPGGGPGRRGSVRQGGGRAARARPGRYARARPGRCARAPSAFSGRSRDECAAGRRVASGLRPSLRLRSAAADLDTPPDLRGARCPRLVQGTPERSADPAGPQRNAEIRTWRPSRSVGPVAPRRARRRGDVPAHLPARRAVPDALRRGVPRADRDRVPAVLALRPVARHLRMDPSTSCQVRDGRWPGPVGPGSGQGDQRPWCPGQGVRRRTAPGRPALAGRPQRRAAARRDRL